MIVFVMADKSGAIAEQTVRNSPNAAENALSAAMGLNGDKLRKLGWTVKTFKTTELKAVEAAKEPAEKPTATASPVAG